jgi:protein-S-isoprenylcysteine O-methyltransferase Ste14
MWRPSIKIAIASALSVAQYVLGFFVFELPGVKGLQWVGWAIWALSVIFAFWPFFLLRKRGKVPRGKSYIHTTELVDTGLYAVCRHPQYVAGLLFNLALMLLAQHWLIIGMGLISATMIYLDIREADGEGIEKFGDQYRRYMAHVPRANFLLGFVRLLRDNK